MSLTALAKRLDLHGNFCGPLHPHLTNCPVQGEPKNCIVAENVLSKCTLKHP